MVSGGKSESKDEFWIFGYGSLIWKPPPHFDRRVPGWVTGYVRRFWQDHRGTPESPGRVVTLIERSYWEQLTDHHDASPDNKVWGVAYRIVPDKVAEVKEYLDIREINGYTIHYAPFHPATPADAKNAGYQAASGSSIPISALVYIGTPDNDQFVGPQDPQELAEHIYRSEGPSGLNRDYLWSLEKSLNELSPESGDKHITDLSNRVRAIAARETKHKARSEEQGQQPRLGEEEVKPGTESLRSPYPASLSPRGNGTGQQQHQHEFRKVSSVEEQEETEKDP